MPKWQISLTRDASQDASVIIEAETAEEAEQIFLHDMDRNAIEWTEGDWLGDTEIVEVLRADDGAKPTPLDTSQKKPGLDAADIPTGKLADIARQIHWILENIDAGNDRVILDPKDVLTLRGIAEQLDVIASDLKTS
jgi:hypothetical protein